jgi:hypothetical protein
LPFDGFAAHPNSEQLASFGILVRRRKVLRRFPIRLRRCAERDDCCGPRRFLKPECEHRSFVLRTLDVEPGAIDRGVSFHEREPEAAPSWRPGFQASRSGAVRRYLWYLQLWYLQLDDSRTQIDARAETAAVQEYPAVDLTNFSVSFDP